MDQLDLSLDDNTGTDGTAALADSEAEAVLDGDRGDQFDVHVNVVAGHAHLNAFGKGDDAGNVSGTEVELGTVVVEERGVTAALFLGEDVHLALELAQGLDGLRSSENLAALDFLLGDAAEQAADVVASLGVLQGLVEHLGTGDDRLLGLKTSYEAYVLLKDLKRTEVLDGFTSILPELQKQIPCEEQYRNFVPGDESDIYAYDAIYCAGHANAGIKLIALNLPYSEEVQAKAGTRTALLRNIMMEKFNRVISPVGIVVLSPDQQDRLDEEAFYWNIAFREISHGLGVKETINGKGSVNDALGNKALTWEDAKANALGLYFVCKLLDEHKIPALITKEDAITTFVANLIRSERFGEASQLGRAYVMLFNYLNQNGAFKRGDSGKYSINYEKTLSLVAEFAGIALKTQATGDYEFAEQFENQYCVLSEDFKADLVNIRLENIPIDLRFEFQK